MNVIKVDFEGAGYMMGESGDINGVYVKSLAAYKENDEVSVFNKDSGNTTIPGVCHSDFVKFCRMYLILSGELDGDSCEMTEVEALDHFRKWVKIDMSRLVDAADHCGVSPAFVSAVMHGKRKITDKMLEAAGLERKVIYIKKAEGKA